MSERISAFPVASLRERHSGDILLFSEARITYDGHRTRGVSQLAGHGDPLLHLPAGYQLAETIAH